LKRRAAYLASIRKLITLDGIFMACASNWRPGPFIARLLFILTILGCQPAASLAQTPSVDGTSPDTSPAAHDKSWIGGSNSVPAEMQMARDIGQQHSRLPGLDAVFSSIQDSRDRLAKKTHIELGMDYQMVYQSVNNSATDIDSGSSGYFRLFGSIALVNRGTANEGKIEFNVEYVHLLWTEVDSQDLGFATGYLGIPALTYGRSGLILTTFTWSQGLFSGNLNLRAGRVDPTHFVDVLGHANMRINFLNLENVVNSSVFIPGPGLGIAAGGFVDDNFYILGLMSDANGSLEEVGFFNGGAEFDEYLEFGWAPSPKQRHFRNVHIGFWHVDRRHDMGTEDSYGVALSAIYKIGDNWTPFFRAGLSKGTAPLMNANASVGMMYKLTSMSDVVGLAFSWSDPADRELRSQFMTELFYRFQISHNFAVSPNLQLIYRPALNPDHNFMAIFGFRFRFHL